MVKFFEKDPLDCSDTELDNYLRSKGLSDSLRLILRSDKIKMVQGFLSGEGRQKLRFEKPDSLISKIYYNTKKWSHQRAEKKSRADDFLAYASAPSVVDSVSSDLIDLPIYQKLPTFEPEEDQQMSTALGNGHRTMPVFNPSPVGSDFSESVDLNIPKRKAPVIPIFVPKPKPRNSLKNREQKFSVIENDRGNNRYYADSPIDQARDSVQISTKPEISKQEISKRDQNFLSQDLTRMSQRPVDKGYKFTAKFDTDKMDIEDYLQNLARWQLANNASDHTTIMQGLQNFSNVGLANSIAETLTCTDFAAFTEEMKVKLGKNRRQWYQTYNRDIRKKDESCFVLLGKLTSHLRLGLGVPELSDEHKSMIVEKFLDIVNPQLRGYLEARDEPVTYENVAEIANRIELAQNIPRTQPASINNFGAIKAKPDTGNSGFRNSSRPQQKLLECHLCKTVGHTMDWCFGNPLSQKYDIKKFMEIQKFRSANKSGN